MFLRDNDKKQIIMHRGDTGSYRVRLVRSSGTAWTEDDRMLYTIAGQNGIVLQRAYRLDRTGKNGKADIEFHNDDTQNWPAGIYNIEVKALINAYWNIADPPTEDVVNLMTLEGAMVDGDVVRTNDPDQTWTLEIKSVIGEV